MVDAHVHIFTDDDKMRARLEANNRDIEDNLLIGVDNARRTLEAGFTTVRDLGSDVHSIIGWSLDDSREQFTRAEMIELFTLDRVGKSPASFDPQKLWAFEDRHMRDVPVESKVPAALLYLQRAGLVPAPPPSTIGPYIARVIAAAGDRIKTMGDILQFREFFVSDDSLPIEGPEFEKLLKAPGAVALLREFAARLESAAAFEPAALEQDLKAFVAERNLKVGQLVHPRRFAVTGRTVGLGLYDALAILGRERSLARIRRAASAAG